MHPTSTPTADNFNFSRLKAPRQMGTVYKDGPVVVLREALLEDLLEYSEQDLTRERGGFLLGGVYGQSPQYVVVRHFHPALQAQGNSASLTFTHETWAALTRETERSFPTETLVGWQHTHPGFGIFLSGYDLFIHKNFFAEPWQVAMVVDPRKREFGFFHWRGGEVRDCGFVCAAEL
jgi:proteasome lid subunit RPN8/RPN11